PGRSRRRPCRGGRPGGPGGRLRLARVPGRGRPAHTPPSPARRGRARCRGSRRARSGSAGRGRRRSGPAPGGPGCRVRRVRRGSGRRGGHGRSRPATSSRGRWDVWWRRVGGAARAGRCAAVRGRRRRGRCRSRCLLVGGGEGEGEGGAVGQVHLEAAVVGVGGPGGVPGGAVGGGVFEGGAVVVVEHARVGPATSGGGGSELVGARRTAEGGGVRGLEQEGGRGGDEPVVEALQPGGGGAGVHAATSSCSCRWRARWRWMVRVDTPSRAASDRRVG